MIFSPLARIFSLGLSVFYPAYSSYKAVRTKNVREYVKWMMYWIVYGAFSGVEYLSDIFIGFWMPFYHELKFLFILWLVSPISSESLGSTIVYRKIIHPYLSKYEEDIDRAMSRFQDQGLITLSLIVRKGIKLFSDLMVENFMKNGHFLARDEPDADFFRHSGTQVLACNELRPFFENSQSYFDRGVTLEQYQSRSLRDSGNVIDEVDHTVTARVTRDLRIPNDDLNSESDAPSPPLSDMEVEPGTSITKTVAKRRGRKPKQDPKTEEPKVEVKKRTVRKKAANS